MIDIDDADDDLILPDAMTAPTDAIILAPQPALPPALPRHAVTPTRDERLVFRILVSAPAKIRFAAIFSFVANYIIYRRAHDTLPAAGQSACRRGLERFDIRLIKLNFTLDASKLDNTHANELRMPQLSMPLMFEAIP